MDSLAIWVASSRVGEMIRVPTVEREISPVVVAVMNRDEVVH